MTTDQMLLTCTLIQTLYSVFFNIKMLRLLCLYRFAKYFKMDNGTEYRTLVKAYAIRFDVLVNGNVSLYLTVLLTICSRFEIST